MWVKIVHPIYLISYIILYASAHVSVSANVIWNVYKVGPHLIAAVLASVTGASLTQGAHLLNCSVPAVSSLGIVNFAQKRALLDSHAHLQYALSALYTVSFVTSTASAELRTSTSICFL